MPDAKKPKTTGLVEYAVWGDKIYEANAAADSIALDQLETVL